MQSDSKHVSLQMLWTLFSNIIAVSVLHLPYSEYVVCMNGNVPRIYTVEQSGFL